MDCKLQDACISGNIEKLKICIKQGLSVHKDKRLISLSIKHGHLKFLKFLEKQGVVISTNKENIRLAAQYKHLNIIKYLVKKGADILEDNNFLISWLSISIGTYEIINYLVRLGADTKYAMTWAANNGKLRFMKYLVKHQGANITNNADEFLGAAISSGNIKILKYLVENGANVQIYNNFPIRMAASSNNLEACEYLISKGADVNSGDSYSLCMATANGNFKLVKLLINHGGVSNGYGNQPLKIALVNSYFEIVIYLINHGAEENTITQYETYNKFVRYRIMREHYVNYVNMTHIRAKKKIYYWVQKYIMTRPNVVYRMGERQWEREQSNIEEFNEKRLK